MKKTFEHFIQTHLGEFCNVRSAGITDKLLATLVNAVPNVGPHLLQLTDHFLFQRPVDDSILVGYAEKAIDRGRPFLHSHLILTNIQDYPELDFHPGLLRKHFITYHQFKQSYTSQTVMDALEVPVDQPDVYSQADLASVFGGDKLQLTKALNQVIAAVSGKTRIKLDFNQIDEATTFWFTILALIPAPLRPFLSSCIGIEPPEAGLYKVILRVARQKVFPISTLTTTYKEPRAPHQLAVNLADSVFTKNPPEVPRNRMKEIWNNLELLQPFLSPSDIIEKALQIYPDIEKVGQILITEADRLLEKGEDEQAKGLLQRVEKTNWVPKDSTQRIRASIEMRRKLSSEEMLRTPSHFLEELKLAVKEQQINEREATGYLDSALRKIDVPARKTAFVAGVLQDENAGRWMTEALVSAILSSSLAELCFNYGIDIGRVVRLLHTKPSESPKHGRSHAEIGAWLTNFNLEEELHKYASSSSPYSSIALGIINELAAIYKECSNCGTLVVQKYLTSFSNLIDYPLFTITKLVSPPRLKARHFDTVEQFQEAITRSNIVDALREQVVVRLRLSKFKNELGRLAWRIDHLKGQE